jgi:hypothetical protein
MFETLLDDAVAMADAEVEAALRATELRARELAAQRAALIAVAEGRGLHRMHEHRSISGYLRANLNTGDGTIARDRKLARLVDAHPAVGDALASGHISVDHALQLSRVHGNRRIGQLLGYVLEVLLHDAEHSSHREFAGQIDEFIAHVDQDGAFADLADSIEGRNAHVSDVGGALVVDVSGGDPIVTAQYLAVFESFVEGEYRRDVEVRRDRWGDDADQHPLDRTPAQRRFDAMIAMAAAAASSPEGRRLPEPTVHIVIDDRSTHDAFTHAGITLPGGDLVDTDGLAAGADVADDTLRTLAEQLVDDPDAFRGRRCETSTGAKIHPMVALKALLTAHVRRVVVDSRGVVIDYGSRQRLFTGAARDAAMLLATTCVHPGCRLPARMCEVDHVEPWSAGGPTDQDNAAIECGTHNRFKHRAGWTTRRDERGRVYNLRPDGTIVLPVGERPPDLGADEARRAARARLQRDLVALRPTA